MTAAADFQNDPLDFLKHNLLLIQFSNLQNGYLEKGPHHFPLEDYAGIYSCRTTGLGRHKDVPVYAITRTSAAGPTTISSYWLPFNINRLSRIVLEDEANLMLTARMDGCSFGFTDCGNGSFTVTHANMQDDQEAIDVGGLKRVMSLEKHVLHRADYKTTRTTRNVGNAKIKVTTFGILVGGKWKFYYQQYEQPPNQTNLKFHGVHRIK
jgi:hypothetical protein